MSLAPPRFPVPFRRTVRRLHLGTATSLADRPGDADPPLTREPDDESDGAAVAEPGWRASSYDLKHGLDVVELPTSLPVDVLDRLFRAPGK